MADKNTPPPIQKKESWRMFDEISGKYDFLNHLLSFRMDILWRKRMVTMLPDREHQIIVDVATGTADVLLTVFRHSQKVHFGYGVDMAEAMLDRGRRKVQTNGLVQRIKLQYGDAEHMPFEANTFDCATIAFGIRNIDQPSQALREMHRVVNKDGRVLILEFSLPKNVLFKWLYLFYLRFFVPFIGWFLTGHFSAYKYLNQTIESFPFGEKFCAMMRKAGFKNVKANPLMFGIATIYQGDK